MHATTELPDDPALPAILAIRALGLAGAIPALDLGDGPLEILLRSYKPGERATLEVRAGEHHFAVKASAYDPAAEVALYEAFAAAGFCESPDETGPVTESGVCVPRLLHWDRALRVILIGWLEGLTAQELIRRGQGERAGELGACWIRCAASLPIRLGPPLGAEGMLLRMGEWVDQLGSADAAQGVVATAILGRLAQTWPSEGERRLVHGTLYTRHLLDLGHSTGVLDWQRFGQGPLEFDAGIYLATLWRTGHMKESHAQEAARAETAFLAGTAGLLDDSALAWYRAATLLRFSQKHVNRRQDDGDWRGRTHVLLGEAARLADAAG